MAGTYYDYAERQANSQINWFQVGKDLTDMLKKESQSREARKKAIDEASRQFGQELENAPQGNSDDVNKWTTGYAADMQQYRLLTDRLLKSGQMKERDYTLIRQNTNDGTKNLFNLAKEYQEEFDAKTKRRMEGKSSESETQFMAMVEGFANLNQTKPMINPPDGTISVGKMVKGSDGVLRLAEGPDNYMTVNQLRQRIKQNIDKYQLNDNLEAESKLLGEVVKEVVTKTGSSTQTGFITKVTDPTKKLGLSQEGKQAVDAYMQAEQQIIDAQLSNPLNTSSVLFDWQGGIDPKSKKPYQVTRDPNEANTSSHYILWGYKGGIFQPDFESTDNGKEQYKEAEQYVRNKFRSMLEQKTEVQPFSQPRKEYAPEYVYGRGDSDKKAADAGNMIAYLYSGTPAQQKAATDYFFGGPNVKSVKRDDEGIVVTYNDGTSKPITFKGDDGNLKSLDDFTRSATNLLLGSDVDVSKVVKNALKTKDKTFKTGEAVSEGVGPKKTGDVNKAYATHLNNIFTGADQPINETEFVDKYQSNFSELGFTIEEAAPGRDAIIIRNQDGKESPTIYLKNPTEAAKQIKAFMGANVSGKDAAEQMIFLKSLQSKGVLTGELD
jgi:hypothetical protein